MSDTDDQAQFTATLDRWAAWESHREHRLVEARDVKARQAARVVAQARCYKVSEAEICRTLKRQNDDAVRREKWLLQEQARAQQHGASPRVSESRLQDTMERLHQDTSRREHLDQLVKTAEQHELATLKAARGTMLPASARDLISSKMHDRAKQKQDKITSSRKRHEDRLTKQTNKRQVSKSHAEDAGSRMYHEAVAKQKKRQNDLKREQQAFIQAKNSPTPTGGVEGSGERMHAYHARYKQDIQHKREQQLQERQREVMMMPDNPLREAILLELDAEAQLVKQQSCVVKRQVETKHVREEREFREEEQRRQQEKEKRKLVYARAGYTGTSTPRFGYRTLQSKGTVHSRGALHGLRYSELEYSTEESDEENAAEYGEEYGAEYGDYSSGEGDSDEHGPVAGTVAGPVTAFSEEPYSTDEESDEEFDKLVSSMEERLGREHAAAIQMDRQYEESHGGGEQVGGGSYTDNESNESYSDSSHEDDSDEL